MKNYWEEVMELIRTNSEEWFDENNDVLDKDEKTKAIKESLYNELPKVIPSIIADDVIPSIVEITRSSMQIGFLKGLELIVTCLEEATKDKE